MKSVWVCEVWIEDAEGFPPIPISATEHRTRARCQARVERLVTRTARLARLTPEVARANLGFYISQVDYDQAPVGALRDEDRLWKETVTQWAASGRRLKGPCNA